MDTLLVNIDSLYVLIQTMEMFRNRSFAIKNPAKIYVEYNLKQGLKSKANKLSS